MEKTKTMHTLANKIHSKASSISYMNRIFIIGGMANAQPLDDVSEVDTNICHLMTRNPMKTKKFYISLCLHSSYIYAIGGATKTNNSICDCQKYSIIENVWHALLPLIKPRSNCASFIWNHYIYAFCGFNINTMERMPIAHFGSWCNISVINPPSKRESILGVPTKNGVIIFGGYNYNKLYR